MADPLLFTEFANLLPKAQIRFWLESNSETSGLASGNLVVADMAPAYWMAEITAINMGNADAMQAQALMHRLKGGLRDFYLCDPRCQYPQYDPDGSILGSATITNTDVNNDGVRMKFSGFPRRYTITPGDMFCFGFGPGNSYRALHQVVVGGTADNTPTGATGWIEFWPPLEDPDLSTGKAMDFTKPFGRFKLVPGSYEAGTAKQMMTTGLSFKAKQVP